MSNSAPKKIEQILISLEKDISERPQSSDLVADEPVIDSAVGRLAVGADQ